MAGHDPGKNLLSVFPPLKKIKKGIKRRSSIEARISESKRLGKLDQNYLKGPSGDALTASMCGVGQNIRIILRYFMKAVKLGKPAASSPY